MRKVPSTALTFTIQLLLVVRSGAWWLLCSRNRKVRSPMVRELVGRDGRWGPVGGLN